MERNITTSDFLRGVYTGEVRRRLIPMEFLAGWPSVSIRSKRICVTIPFFRARLCEEGKVALYPISYLMTLLWPQAVMIEFRSLAYDKEYRGIDVGKPIGFMRDETRLMPKAEYKAKREKLFSHYDRLIDCILKREGFEREPEMRALFGELMEPALYPMYQKFARNFFDAYCSLETEAE